MPEFSPMEPSDFWALIEEARNSVKRTTDVPTWLTSHLLKQPPEYIVRYHLQFNDASCDAYDARLWAAAGLMLGYCSDERFYDFRGWLIAQGRTPYELALQNPDTLADLNHTDGDRGMPLLFYMNTTATRAYWELTRGGDLFSNVRLIRKPELMNEDSWIEDHRRLQRKFPRLYAKFAQD